MEKKERHNPSFMDIMHYLYSGLTTNLVAQALSYGLYFWWLRFFKETLFHSQIMTSAEIVTVTTMAGVIATCMTNPIWFVNTRLSLASKRIGVFSMIYEIA